MSQSKVLQALQKLGCPAVDQLNSGDDQLATPRAVAWLTGQLCRELSLKSTLQSIDGKSFFIDMMIIIEVYNL